MQKGAKKTVHSGKTLRRFYIGTWQLERTIIGYFARGKPYFNTFV